MRWRGNSRSLGIGEGVVSGGHGARCVRALTVAAQLSKAGHSERCQEKLMSLSEINQHPACLDHLHFKNEPEGWVLVERKGKMEKGVKRDRGQKKREGGRKRC